MLSIPPKYSVADVIGYIKGKSAIHIARNADFTSGAMTLCQVLLKSALDERGA